MTEVEEITIRRDDGVRLCTQAFGDRHDPAIVLIGGATWSMDWWEDEFCHRIARRGRRVVRYDQRDTGRSTSYPQGTPGYTSHDLVDDVVAVLDGLGIDRAHVGGLSMGGGVAQRLAASHPDRVSTVTLMSTSPVDPTIEGLPGPTPEIQATFSADAPEPDWHDRAAVVDYLIEGERPYAGPGNFDEAKLRGLAGHVFDRTNDMAACLTNHFILTGGDAEDEPRSPDIAVPALILHGTADPLFPLEHGRALESSIPGARLVELEDVGHQLPPERYWDEVVDALIEHTEPD